MNKICHRALGWGLPFLLLLVVFSPVLAGVLPAFFLPSDEGVRSAVMLDTPPSSMILVAPYLILVALGWKMLRYSQRKPVYSYSLVFAVLALVPNLIILAALPPWVLIASLGQQSIKEYRVKVVAYDRQTRGSKGAVYHWLDVTHPLKEEAVLSYVDDISSRFNLDSYDSRVSWSIRWPGARACVRVNIGLAGLSWAEWPTRCGASRGGEED